MLKINLYEFLDVHRIDLTAILFEFLVLGNDLIHLQSYFKLNSFSNSTSFLLLNSLLSNFVSVFSYF